MENNKQEIKLCSVEHCDRKAKSKGYCGRHYQSYNRHGDPLYTEKKGTSKTTINKPLPYEETHQIMEGIEHKLCRHCEDWFPMNDDYFYKKKASDGFDTYCKECVKKKTNKWRQDNYYHWRKTVAKLESKPKIRLKKRKDSKIQRENGYLKQWIKDNPEKVKEYQQKHRKHDINSNEWRACKEYFNNSCAYCGIQIDNHYITINGKRTKSDLHKEHVNHEGENDLSNCVPACRSCNSQKWTFSLEDWYNESYENFDQDKLNKIHKWINEDYLNYIK